MVNFTRFDSIISLASYFSNEEICRQFLKEQRWGSVVVCPYCGSVHVYACGDGKRFKCDGCGNKFSVLVGTIFENTKLPLRKWFMAMYLLSSHKKGVSSHQIARDIEVTQKTAWFMLHKIRTLLGQEDNVTLADEVECDEAYMGGREKNKHESKRTEATRGRSTKTKTPVFGMVQRGGKVELPNILFLEIYSEVNNRIQNSNLFKDVNKNDKTKQLAISQYVYSVITMHLCTDINTSDKITQHIKQLQGS